MLKRANAGRTDRFTEQEFREIREGAEGMPLMKPIIGFSLPKTTLPNHRKQLGNWNRVSELANVAQNARGLE